LSLSYCHEPCRSQEIRIPPETNVTAKDFLFSTNRFGFPFVAQASKFAGLSDDTNSGISVAEFINRAAEVGRDEERKRR